MGRLFMSIRKAELEREIKRLREKISEYKRLSAYHGRSMPTGYLERQIKELEKAIAKL